MSKKFNNYSRFVQVILLLIPIVNWITEILVRWSAWKEYKDISHFVFALLITILGIIPIVGWIDIIWCFLFKHMFYAAV